MEAIEKEKFKHLNLINETVKEQTIESTWIFSSDNILNAIDESSDEFIEFNCYIGKKELYSNRELIDHNNSKHKMNKSNELLSDLKCKNCNEKLRDNKELEKTDKSPHAIFSLLLTQQKNH